MPQVREKECLSITGFDEEFDADGSDLIAGLKRTPKIIPPHYAYDEIGSKLYEQITQLPDYYLSRLEAEILRIHAQDIFDTTGQCALVELGSGNSRKTRILISHYLSRYPKLRYIPNDISKEILVENATRLLEDYPGMSIDGIVASYDRALEAVKEIGDDRKLFIFLGTSIGNLGGNEFDHMISKLLMASRSGDFLLLGIDLLKEPSILEAAYNDDTRITEAFIKRRVIHVNNLFGGNFDLGHITADAVYSAKNKRIEARLYSDIDQEITLTRLGFSFRFSRDEYIVGDIMQKFNLQEFAERLTALGYTHKTTWTDADSWYGVMLFRA